jgi:hypothetical protein
MRFDGDPRAGIQMETVRRQLKNLRRNRLNQMPGTCNTDAVDLSRAGALPVPNLKSE